MQRWFVTRSTSLICFWWIYSSGSRSVLLLRAALVFPLIIWPRLFLWNGAASENTRSPSVSSSRVQLHKRPSETHYSQPSLQQQQMNWTVQEIQLFIDFSSVLITDSRTCYSPRQSSIRRLHRSQRDVLTLHMLSNFWPVYLLFLRWRSVIVTLHQSCFDAREPTVKHFFYFQ